MAIEHDSISDSELHEPRGVSSAGAGLVYVSDGVGSGSWQQISVSSISDLNNANKMVLVLDLHDLSVAQSHYMVMPLAGSITNVWSVIDQAIASADTVLTINIGGVAVTGGVITITQSGSAEGDVDSCTPSALNTFTAGQAVEVACDGGTTTTDARATLTFLIDVS